MRIVKEAAERRNEILDVAERLFCTNGYDNTSTNDILAEIGINVGPDGGTGGGQIVFTGTPGEMAEKAHTITAEYLRKSL